MKTHHCGSSAWSVQEGRAVFTVWYVASFKQIPPGGDTTQELTLISNMSGKRKRTTSTMSTLWQGDLGDLKWSSSSCHTVTLCFQEDANGWQMFYPPLSDPVMLSAQMLRYLAQSLILTALPTKSPSFTAKATNQWNTRCEALKKKRKIG